MTQHLLFKMISIPAYHVLLPPFRGPYPRSARLSHSLHFQGRLWHQLGRSEPRAAGGKVLAMQPWLPVSMPSVSGGTIAPNIDALQANRCGALQSYSAV